MQSRLEYLFEAIFVLEGQGGLALVGQDVEGGIGGVIEEQKA